MYAKVALWNVVGRNQLGAITWRMDIAAPNQSDAIYVAKQLAAHIPHELVFSTTKRKKNGEVVRVGMGYVSEDDHPFPQIR